MSDTRSPPYKLAQPGHSQSGSDGLSESVDVEKTRRIALCEPSDNRVDRVKWPLEEVGHTVDIAPDDPNSYDIILLDTPGARILRYGWENVESPVIYRHRGNLWKAHRKLRFGRLRSAVFSHVAIPWIDGVLSPSHRLDRMMRSRAHNPQTAVAEMPINPQNWPSVEHSDHEIRALTLTNMDYKAKVDPIRDWIPAVDEILDTGHWRIAGDGQYADIIDRAAAGLENVEYIGYVDPKPELANANLLLHPSWFDIAVPNAILEGLASRLPVVTTPFEPFATAPVRQVRVDGLEMVLAALRSPDERMLEVYGHDQYLQRHRPSKIGRDITAFIESLL